MKPEWKDATIYSQGERGKINPTAWECFVGGSRVLIMSGHLSYPGQWVMNFRAADIVEHDLKLTSHDELAKVQAAALGVVEKAARDLSIKMAMIADAAREAGQ